MSTRTQDWTHTHNATLDGELIQLSREAAAPDDPNGAAGLFFEKDASEPSWMMRPNGSIRRFAAKHDRDHGIIVEAALRADGYIYGA